MYSSAGTRTRNASFMAKQISLFFRFVLYKLIFQPFALRSFYNNNYYYGKQLRQNRTQVKSFHSTFTKSGNFRAQRQTHRARQRS